MKLVIYFLKLAILLRGKNWARKAIVSASQVVMHPYGKECNQALTLSLNEKGNKRRQIASLETQLSFNVSHTSKKTERCDSRLQRSSFKLGLLHHEDECQFELEIVGINIRASDA